MGEIGVVHLVRRKNGIAPFERFLASYLQHAAGQPHELVPVFKGFHPWEVWPITNAVPRFDPRRRGVPHQDLLEAIRHYEA